MVLTTVRGLNTAKSLEDIAIQGLQMTVDGVVANLAMTNNLSFERVLPRDGIMHIGVTVRGDEEIIDKIARFLRRAGFISFKVVEDDTAGLQSRADFRADIASAPVAGGLLNQEGGERNAERQGNRGRQEGRGKTGSDGSRR